MKNLILLLTLLIIFMIGFGTPASASKSKNSIKVKFDTESFVMGCSLSTIAEATQVHGIQLTREFAGQIEGYCHRLLKSINKKLNTKDKEVILVPRRHYERIVNRSRMDFFNGKIKKINGKTKNNLDD